MNITQIIQSLESVLAEIQKWEQFLEDVNVSCPQNHFGLSQLYTIPTLIHNIHNLKLLKVKLNDNIKFIDTRVFGTNDEEGFFGQLTSNCQIRNVMSILQPEYFIKGQTFGKHGVKMPPQYTLKI